MSTGGAAAKFQKYCDHLGNTEIHLSSTLLGVYSAVDEISKWWFESIGHCCFIKSTSQQLELIQKLNSQIHLFPSYSTCWLFILVCIALQLQNGYPFRYHILNLALNPKQNKSKKGQLVLYLSYREENFLLSHCLAECQIFISQSLVKEKDNILFHLALP